ncbi:MAG: metallophosphoesterase [Pseudomonadota bacterium]|nr:metallophosphoesterase [Pseudomonadota bacterium]
MRFVSSSGALIVIRFLHSSDIHLGKPFGRFDEDVRAALKVTRQSIVSRLGSLAQERHASHVLLAGDTFDAETPPPRVIRQMLNDVAKYPDVTWVILPGNHDSLAATELWRVLRRDAPENLLLAIEAKAITLNAQTVLLPAPCTARDPGRDLTAWMEGHDTGNMIRLGLAHGSIRDFRSSEDIGGTNGGVIPPDRSTSAKLDYLAIGDWHGRIEVSPNTWYSGTPEPDSFKEHRTAGCNLVEITTHGQPAKVEEVPLGQLVWRHLDIDLTETDDFASIFHDQMPDVHQRQHCLFEVVMNGRQSLGHRQDAIDLFKKVAPDFLHFEVDMSRLSILPDTTDLDKIDTTGALRHAADVLAQEAEGGDKIAASALARLFSYAEGEA